MVCHLQLTVLKGLNLHLEIMSSVIRSLEIHPPKVQNTFTFSLLAEVP